jgi:hypothetical protein
VGSRQQIRSLIRGVLETKKSKHGDGWFQGDDDSLMLNKPSTIVGPEAASKISDYLKKMGLAENSPIAEAGPVTVDDGSGMVDFRRPATDPVDVDKEMDKDQFVGIARRAYDTALSQDDDVDIEAVADEFAERMRKIAGIEVNREDLDTELGHVDKEREEFKGKTPEEKQQYHADPKWYTKYF